MPDFSTGGEIIIVEKKWSVFSRQGLAVFRFAPVGAICLKSALLRYMKYPIPQKPMSLLSASSSFLKRARCAEITDIRDETDLSGLRIAIDLKRGVDPEQLMAKLFRSTTLQDSFSCNFNVLVDGYPRVMGVRQILHEWVAWRIESTRRRMNFDLNKKTERRIFCMALRQFCLILIRRLPLFVTRSGK